MIATGRTQPSAICRFRKCAHAGAISKISIVSLSRLAHLGNGFFGRMVNVPDQAQPREQANHGSAEIWFPPSESVAGGSWKSVMIILQALTEGERGDNVVVDAVVARLEAL